MLLSEEGRITKLESNTRQRQKKNNPTKTSAFFLEMLREHGTLWLSFSQFLRFVFKYSFIAMGRRPNTGAELLLRALVVEPRW